MSHHHSFFGLKRRKSRNKSRHEKDHQQPPTETNPHHDSDLKSSVVLTLRNQNLERIDSTLNGIRQPNHAHHNRQDQQNHERIGSPRSHFSRTTCSSNEPTTCDVVVIGAGPAGLMLAANLARFGVTVEVIEKRGSRTPTGRADILQPKTIETLRQMRLAEHFLYRGVKVHDVSFWAAGANSTLTRMKRQAPYGDIDLLDPYVLMAHQGMVEELLLDDLRERGIEVKRNMTFVDYNPSAGRGTPIEVISQGNDTGVKKSITTQFLVGCDGAHSQVRKRIPGSRPIGAATDAIWGVLDGVVKTDFPDAFTVSVIHSNDAGSVLLFPRERNMTRLYIELKSEIRGGTSREELSQDFVIARASEIMHPFVMEWETIEWFGRYQVGHRVATKFADEDEKVFIAGDAGHTHSPKSAQGMNTALHDSWNLAWKLNLAIRGLAKPCLLATYEQERLQLAQDLIEYDQELSEVVTEGDATAITENVHRNARFGSGLGADYGPNPINVASKNHHLDSQNILRPGCLPPPAKVCRYIDSNPVDLQLDVPMLGQFRIYIFTRNILTSRSFVDYICSHASANSSVVGRLSAAANASYTIQPPPAAESDEYLRPERYTSVSGLFTFALVTSTPKDHLEVEDLPPLLQDSKWTIYLDNVPEMDTKRKSCTEKWLGEIGPSEVAIVNMRPDGYVGSIGRWRMGTRENGVKAAAWLDDYYDGFLTTGY